MAYGTFGDIPRVTNIVKEIFGGIEPGWLGMCKKEDSPNPIDHDEDLILKESAMFGTAMHEVCLEWDISEASYDCRHPRAIKQKMADRMKKDGIHHWFTNSFDALGHYVRWKNKYEPARIKVEQQLTHPEKIYAGTADMICRIDGRLCLVDLKFFGFWKEVFGYAQAKEILPSNKSGKINLQTKLYEIAYNKGEMDRYTLIIHPGGYKFKKFTRCTKTEEAIGIARSLYGDSKEALLDLI